MSSDRLVENWLRSNLKTSVKRQARKPRYGNRFMVIGAGGYLGWATLCQIAYKFPGSIIYAVDEKFDYQKGAKTLRKLFGCKIIVIKEKFSKFLTRSTQPDVIINLSDKNLSFEIIANPHIILLAEFKGNHKNPVTVLRTPMIIGNWNMVTLRNKNLKIKSKSMIGFIIDGRVRDMTFPVLSLEDFTRTIVKICRKTNPPNYDTYDLMDRYIYISKDGDIITENVRPQPDKTKFIKLIDKHRPSLESVIKWSLNEAT